MNAAGELVSTPYTLSGVTSLTPRDAEAQVREALAAEGFGVLTEIDVEATLRAKLGEEIGPYRILGACSPRDAHDALGVEIELGALLPCNVVIYARDGSTHVCVIDPVAMLSIVHNDQVQPVAEAIRERLRRALEKVWMVQEPRT